MFGITSKRDQRARESENQKIATVNNLTRELSSITTTRERYERGLDLLLSQISGIRRPNGTTIKLRRQLEDLRAGQDITKPSEEA